MSKITLYTKTKCPKCDVVKNELKRHNVEYTEVYVDSEPLARQLLIDAGHRSVPVIYRGDKAISLKELIKNTGA